MWTNIWEALKLLVSYGDRLTRVEKELRELRDEQKASIKDLIALALKVERLAERENWREEKLRQEMEIERIKTENERLKLEIEMERQRLSLPPATDRKDKQS